MLQILIVAVTTTIAVRIVESKEVNLGRAMAQAVSRRPLTAEARVRSRGQFMWDLWWTKWHWDRFFPEYFGFFLSISFHQCSITWKNKKKLIIFLFIFIIGLHNKP
jgi:hypothetical protein